MSANRMDNIAYDFSLFESSAAPEINSPVKRKSEEEKKSNIVKLSKKQAYADKRIKRNPVKVAGAVVGAIAIALIASTVITSQVHLTELTESCNAATTTLNQSKSEYTQLEMGVESKLSLQEVENYAKNTLGMTYTEPYQLQYINLSNGDKAEIPNADNMSLTDKVKNSISGWLE